MPPQNSGCDDLGNLRGLIAARFDRVQRVQPKLLARRGLIRVRLVPLRNLRVQIPADVVEPRVRLQQLRHPAAHSIEIHAFQGRNRNHNVRHLHAGVVDIVLHAGRVAGLVIIGPHHAREAVAENCVAQMPDVRGLVRIDARVFDQAEAFAADAGVLIRSDTLRRRRAVELHIQIARAGDLHARHTVDLRQLGLQLLRNRARRLLEPLGKLKRDRQRHLAKLELRRQLNRELRQLHAVALAQQRLDARLNCLLQNPVHSLNLN